VTSGSRVSYSSTAYAPRRNTRRPVEGFGTTGLAKASRLLTDRVATVAQCGLRPSGRLSGTDLIRLDTALAVFHGSRADHSAMNLFAVFAASPTHGCDRSSMRSTGTVPATSLQKVEVAVRLPLSYGDYSPEGTSQ
jgi:hypothetical protein